MRVFLMCVGNRDPYWMKDQDGKTVVFNVLLQMLDENYDRQIVRKGPILTFFDKNIPKPEDKIYLLSTAEGGKVKGPTRIGGDKVIHEMKMLYSLKDNNFRHWPISGIDPSDFAEVIPIMKERLLAVLDENPLTTEYLVNVSPGTPQMQAVWYILVNAGLIKARLLRPIEKEAPEEAEVKEITIAPLFEEGIKDIGINLFTCFSFKAASDVFKDLSVKTIDPRRKSLCELFGNLFEIYFDWSIFKYDDALEKMKKLMLMAILKTKELMQLERLLSTQKNSLEELTKELVSPKVKAIDLYHGAELKFTIGDYVDCIWRCYAVCEQVLINRSIVCIQRKFDVFLNPRDFKRSVEEHLDEEWIREELLKQIFRGSIKTRFLNAQGASKILEKLGEEFRKYLRVDIEWLRKKRHNAIHESKSVTTYEAKRGYEIAKRTLIEQFGSGIKNDIKRYAFSTEKLLMIQQFLERTV